jgi:hypothetical protein
MLSISTPSPTLETLECRTLPYIAGRQRRRANFHRSCRVPVHSFAMRAAQDPVQSILCGAGWSCPESLKLLVELNHACAMVRSTTTACTRMIDASRQQPFSPSSLQAELGMSSEFGRDLELPAQSFPGTSVIPRHSRKVREMFEWIAF